MFVQYQITKRLNIINRFSNIGTVCRHFTNILTISINSIDFSSINFSQFLDSVKFWFGSGYHLVTQYEIVHYAMSAMKRFLTSVSLQHEPKASDVITLVKKTFFARVSYEILYHEVWKCGNPHFHTRSEIKVFLYYKDTNKI